MSTTSTLRRLCLHEHVFSQQLPEIPPVRRYEARHLLNSDRCTRARGERASRDPASPCDVSGPPIPSELQLGIQRPAPTARTMAVTPIGPRRLPPKRQTTLSISLHEPTPGSDTPQNAGLPQTPRTGSTAASHPHPVAPLMTQYPPLPSRAVPNCGKNGTSGKADIYRRWLTKAHR